MAFTRKTGNRLRFESLEQRRMMAGDVSVKLIGGTLYIKGDYLDNNITVGPGGSADQVVVSGLTAGGAPTSINGTPNGTTTVSGFTRGLKIDMLEGDDTVAVSNITVRGNATVNTDGGVDVVTISGVTVKGNLKVKTGASADTLTINNTTVSGNTKLLASVGNDNLIVTGLATQKLGAKLGKGNDMITVTDTTTAESFLHGGEGVNTFMDNGDNLLYNLSTKRFG